MMSRVFLLLLLTAGVSWAQQPAMILRLDGHAQVTAGERTYPARTLLKLPEGASVRVQDGKITFFYFADRHQEVATGPTVVRVTPSGGEGKGLQRQAASGSVSAMPAGNVGRMGGFAVRGSGRPRLIMSGTAGVQPRVEWRLPSPAPSPPYRITLATAAGEQIWSQDASGTAATYAGPPLKEGAIYQWKLSAGGEPVQRRFQVVSAKTVQTLNELRSQAERAPKDDAGPYLLLMALYTDYGCLEEAIAAGQAAAVRRPQDGGIQAALADLYEQAGQYEEMGKASEKARALGVEDDF